MKYFSLLILSCSVLLACASQKDGKYREDPTPKFADGRDYEQKPDELRPVVDELLRNRMRDSSPATEGDLKSEGIGHTSTPWVYDISRDKFILVDFNGVPKRIPFKVRRRFGYQFVSSVAGSRVTAKVEEEIQDLDKKTGSPKGWKSVTPDRNLFDEMLKDLDTALRSR